MSLAVLPEVLEQVQTKHGAGPALVLGMKLLGSFETVYAIILSNIRGEASVLRIRQRLAGLPAAEREHALPTIIAETYTSVGRDTLGLKALKPNSSTRSDVDDVRDRPNTEAAKKKSLRGRSREKTGTESPQGDSSRGGGYNLRNRDKI